MYNVEAGAFKGLRFCSVLRENVIAKGIFANRFAKNVLMDEVMQEGRSGTAKSSASLKATRCPRSSFRN